MGVSFATAAKIGLTGIFIFALSLAQSVNAAQSENILDTSACRIQIPEIDSAKLRGRLSVILGGDKGAACPFNDGEEAIVYLACSSPEITEITGKLTRLSRREAIQQVMTCSPTYSIDVPDKSNTARLDTLVYYGPHPEPDRISEAEMLEWAKSSFRLAREIRALGLPLTYYNSSNSVICMSTRAGASPSTQRSLADVAAKVLPANAKMLMSHESCPTLVLARFHVDLPYRLPASPP